ncbi:MAG TPA: Asp-tRNA(Asn)/Glu-tRNA(Gln) amidotransferase subunit GatA [Chitinophagaceae bacterium]|nr:Asp-tRNA(Asn)/Glu-tRNA(Gln) amidotransferase subunit GatA [Chitinophagaceae bacterium]
MFEFSSIAQYHRRLQEGSVTCVQAVTHYLQAIRSGQRLNAFTEVYEEEALQRAEALDTQRSNGSPCGRLHGVVIGIKDVICYKDHQVTAASRILQGFVSVYSATAVERLLAEGAIIIGSLNCDEFAMGSTNENSVYGRVHNAADESRVSGGSSGGSAVAVQAGLCMAALGSDTGGSVRQPADFCGVIGLKPSYGRISRYGLIAYASSFDQIGIFATTVADTALLLEVMAGADEYDSTVSALSVPHYSSLPDKEEKKTCKIAYFEEALNHPAIDPEISRAIKDKIAALRAAGHQVEAVPFPLLDYVVPAYYVLTTAEASSNLSRYDGIKYGYRASTPASAGLDTLYKTTRSQGFGKEVKRRIMLGTFVLSAGYYDAYFTRAQKVRNLLYQQTQLIFNDYDFIISPNSPSVAFKAGEKTADPVEMYLADIYTVMANLVGIPAISLPLFRHSTGMPFGLQVMTNRFEELSLLRFSNLLMQA